MGQVAVPPTPDVKLDPDEGLQATLDPGTALTAGTIYTVDVGSGVEDIAGNMAVPFTSTLEANPELDLCASFGGATTSSGAGRS